MSCPVLIGRESEEATLTAALAVARGGAGGMVVVTGEAGIGKSRLVGEMATTARTQGVGVLIGRGVPAAASHPYNPLTEALLQGLREHSVLHDDGMRPWLPMLRAVIPTIAASAADPDAVHSTAARGEAVLQLLRCLAGPGCLLLVLEDLHWADADTLAVLEYLCENLSTNPVLCVATCRVEPPTPAAELCSRLRVRRAGTHLALKRLTADQVTAMVRACVPAATPDVVDRVQQAADGVPFLVEEALVTPGIPRFFADGVRVRFAALTRDEQTLLHSAAMLGRRFDWRLLSAMTALTNDAIATALEQCVDKQLLVVADDTFAFRHTLTRDAVLAGVLPPRRAELASRAFEALEAAHPGLPGIWGDLGADLAVQAGDPVRAGSLLLASGRAALGRGALATAIDTLRRAIELVTSPAERVEADCLLLDAFAMAGRLEEAIEVGDRLIGREGPHDAADAATRAELHLKIAHAALSATRWALARRQIALAADAVANDPQPQFHAQMAVLKAEMAMADHDLEGARALAESVLSTPSTSPTIRCHSLELLGRIRRGSDLGAAREAFEDALATAYAAGLVVWRLRALHELGTIDMFDHAGSDRLSSARGLAAQPGAGSTGAVIDLQLAATGLFRFELEAAARHARSALEVSTRLGLEKVRATALVFLAEVCALHRDRAESEHFVSLAEAAAPGDREIVGSGLGGAYAMLALLDDDIDIAMDDLGRAVAMLDRLPPMGPAHYRALWPLLLAARGDPDAAPAIERAGQAGLTVNRINRGFLGYASAIVAGRSGDQQHANNLAAEAAPRAPPLSGVGGHRQAMGGGSGAQQWLGPTS